MFVTSVWSVSRVDNIQIGHLLSVSVSLLHTQNDKALSSVLCQYYDTGKGVGVGGCGGGGRGGSLMYLLGDSWCCNYAVFMAAIVSDDYTEIHKLKAAYKQTKNIWEEKWYFILFFSYIIMACRVRVYIRVGDCHLKPTVVGRLYGLHLLLQLHLLKTPHFFFFLSFLKLFHLCYFY